jgi:ribonuclease HI
MWIRGGGNVKNIKPMTVYVDGSGADPNGVSGRAWVRSDGREHVEWERGWTNNEAEYHAVLSALQALPKGARAEVRCDSQLVVNQLRGAYQTREPRLCDLGVEVQRVISARRLHITWRWVRRVENQADRLLRRRPAVIPKQRAASSVRPHRRKRRRTVTAPALVSEGGTHAETATL